MKKLITPKQDGIFLYLLLLTGFFLLLEISFFIQCNHAYFADFSFVSDQLHLPLAILPGIVFFIFAQLLVHLCYCFIVWVLTLAIADLLHLSSQQKLLLGISFWVVGMVAVLAANQYFFPNSKFAEISSVIFFNDSINKAIVMISVILISATLVLAILGNRLLRIILFGLLLPFGYIHFIENKTTIPIDASSAEKPNIILIGIDSLRPDFLSFFAHDKPTPFLDALLEQSTVFSEAVTPLARTFPSWTGILTGEYPRESGVRTNLAQQSHIDLSQTLPVILKKQGYDTLYATDETRFSNIDKNYGFDRVISPPMGLNDFLLGTFNDFPLSNLLINTPIGKWLFPYSYANRAVYFSYQPNSFLNLIQPDLYKNRHKPLFLAVHFCLPHHPYLWASLSGYVYKPLERYEMSIVRADQQLRDLFAILEQVRLLDHAVVVLLSDHGEALELDGDRITEDGLFLRKTAKSAVPTFFPPSLEEESVNQSVGHGTDVLSLTQYHTLLAFKLYGTGQQQSGVVPGVVSLLDIKPTVLDLANVNEKLSNKNSLAVIVRGKAKTIHYPNHVFLESDFTPGAIRTVYPETRQVMLEGIKIFQINPSTTRLTVKDDMDKMIIKSKQYADIYGNWELALYPQNNHYRMPILVNLVSGEWTNDLNSEFAKHSPAAEMLLALQAFYGDELN